MIRILSLFIFITLLASPAEAKPLASMLDWGDVPDAQGYEVEITGLSLKFKKIYKTKKSRWKAYLKPGQYNLRMRSLDNRGVPGPWSEAMSFYSKLPPIQVASPKDKSRIQSKDDSTEEVKLSWKGISGIDQYRIEVKDATKKTVYTTDTRSLKKELDLPVAKTHFIWVMALDKAEKVIESSKSRVRIKVYGAQLEAPEIIAPKTRYVDEILWKATENASSYDYKVLIQSQNKKKSGWKLIERKTNKKDTRLAFDLSRPSGIYKLMVRARGKMRPKSKWASQTFEVRGGIRNPASIPSLILQDSIQKPTKYYAIASYLISQIQYTGTDFTSVSQSQFNSLGGTGRVGLGYQSLLSPWGVFGVIDMSGFTIDGENFTFPSAEITTTYKFYAGLTNQFKVSTGVYYKSLPALQGNQATGFEGVGNLDMQGLNFGVEYWKPFSKTYGLKMHGVFYYPLMASTPNNQPFVSEISYQAGALGSYKFNRQLMGLAGVTIRKDQGSYNAISNSQDPFSSAPDGAINTISIEGLYLNFILEYAF